MNRPQASLASMRSSGRSTERPTAARSSATYFDFADALRIAKCTSLSRSPIIHAGGPARCRTNTEDCAAAEAIRQPVGPAVRGGLVPHNALYNYGRMQEVWLDKWARRTVALDQPPIRRAP